MSKEGIIADGFTRAYPMFIVIYSLMNGLLNNSKENIVFCGILMISDMLNNILKRYIFAPLMGKGYRVPLLGIGTRPPNSKNSGLFKDGTLSNTYGMPSGHAQISWLFATYWSLKIWNDKRGAPSKIISIMVLCFFATMVTYSRVYWAKCHTVQQVVVGSVVGIILGNISYKGLQIYFPPAN